jgi:hypothetical protein
MPLVRTAALVVSLLLPVACSSDTTDATDAESADKPARMPSYAPDGALQRPDDWQDWTFLGASLNLSYSATPSRSDVFSVVYMEPTAVAHFEATGELREGTMTALATYDGATDAAPAKNGQFPGAMSGFEMSVKDGDRHPGATWGYYIFGTDGATARAQDPSSCFACHDANAETDHVFTQFYPRLP